jgi:hypothetical protein
VEGVHLGTGRENETKHRVHVFENIMRGNSDDAKALALENCITSRIASGLITERMGLPIDFNYKTSLQAGEINGHFAERKLLPELQSVRPSPKLLPQKHFWQTHFEPQPASALHLLDW